MLTYTAAWIIAAKYHGVAKQIDAVLRQGILIKNQKLHNHKISYTLFCIFAVGVSIVLITLDQVSKAKNKRSKFVVYSLALWETVCISALFVSFGLSQFMIYKAAQKATDVRTIMSRKIFALNLTFSALFLLSNLMFFYGIKG